MINTESKIEICSALGKQILQDLDSGNLNDLIAKARIENPWFTSASITQALKAIAINFLNKSYLEEWVDHYSLDTLLEMKTVGLVMAGNIPAVGFHDLLSVFISNHRSQVKYSGKDGVIIPYLLDQMIKINPEAASYFSKEERLKGYDAIIATGGNNTSRYFEYYFKDVPHIIRKSRSAIALLTGEESEKDLLLLGRDIFNYFGLGCRNVSKLYLPRNYNLNRLLEVLHTFNEVNLHHKYKNNFDYNIALFLLNKEPFLNNGSVILKEDKQIASRIACINFEYYDDREEIINELHDNREEIQCIVSAEEIEGFECVGFGKAQSPSLMDYADGIDTMQFLLTL